MNGLTLGVSYLLVAVSFGLIYSVSGVLNVAQANLYMLGAFGSAYVVEQIGGGIAVALLAGAAVGALAGAFLQLGVLRWFRTDQPLAAFVATVGIGQALEYGVARIRGTQGFPYPTLISSTAHRIGDMEISISEVFTWVAAAVIVVGLMLWIRHTKSGREIRVVAENEDAAMALGIRVSAVKLITLSVAGALAGIAGPLICQFTGQYSAFMGDNVALEMFIIVLVAGSGSIGGIAVVGIGLGVFESLVVQHFGSQWQSAVGLICLIIVVLVRPRGLFGRVSRFS